VTTSPWAAQRLITHRDARRSRGPLRPDTTLIYTGLKGANSDSAKIASDRMISRAVKAAGFRTQDQITVGGLSLWRAAHTALHHGLEAGAAIHGTDPLNLLRKLTHAADRSYRVA
jgi:hypothetical protein